MHAMTHPKDEILHLGLARDACSDLKPHVAPRLILSDGLNLRQYIFTPAHTDELHSSQRKTSQECATVKSYCRETLDQLCKFCARNSKQSSIYAKQHTSTLKLCKNISPTTAKIMRPPSLLQRVRFANDAITTWLAHRLAATRFTSPTQTKPTRLRLSFCYRNRVMKNEYAPSPRRVRSRC